MKYFKKMFALITVGLVPFADLLYWQMHSTTLLQQFQYLLGLPVPDFLIALYFLDVEKQAPTLRSSVIKGELYDKHKAQSACIVFVLPSAKTRCGKAKLYLLQRIMLLNASVAKGDFTHAQTCLPP